MKYVFRILFLVIFLFSCTKESASTFVQTNQGNPVSLLPSINKGYIINHTYYSLSYSDANRQAEWVFYNLTPEQINGTQARTDDFRADALVKNNPVKSTDYTGSGYDRGHLCPAADMSLNLTSMSETFYMSNMTPQNPSFNRGIWSTLEDKVRSWAIEKNGVYVATGPILNNNCGAISNGTITVPCSFYKIVYKDTGADKIAVAFILNNQGSTANLKTFVCNIDQIETLTGIDFFSALPDDVENKLESSIYTSNWSW
jgi:endonuclease G